MIWAEVGTRLREWHEILAEEAASTTVLMRLKLDADGLTAAQTVRVELVMPLKLRGSFSPLTSARNRRSMPAQRSRTTQASLPPPIDVTRSAGNLGPFFLAAGAPTGTELKAALADGNKAVFDDVYWQHVAFQQGGVPALEQAFQAGQLSNEQMEAWRKLGAARQAQGGPSTAAAQSQVWDASKSLLHYEQSETLQKGVYDTHRDAFAWLSGNMNPAGLDSPIPGDVHSFGSSVPGGDIGDLADRWGWIEHSMLPAWQARDAGSPTAVRADQLAFEQHGAALKQQVSAARARHELGQVE